MSVLVFFVGFGLVSPVQRERGLCLLDQLNSEKLQKQRFFFLNQNRMHHENVK